MLNQKKKNNNNNETLIYHGKTMVVYQKTMKLRFIIEKKNKTEKKHGTIPKRLKFLNKYVEVFKQA